MNIALIVGILDMAIWSYLLFGRGGFWQAETDSTVYTEPAIWPDVTVIIPARNEAYILKDTLPTLLGQDYPAAFHILLVDDRSEDDTASVALSVAEQMGTSAGLTIVKDRPLRADWKGKVAAMQCGLQYLAATGALPRYILFTDADIAYDAGAIKQLVAEAEARKTVLTSRMVMLRCRSIAEGLLIPAFVYFFQMLYPFRWVNKASHRMAAAAGGCMLVRSDALQKAGGMEPIRGALIDDCALGRLMKSQGPISLSLTKHIHSLRPYPHISDIRSMVARSAYDQLDYSPLKLAFAVLGLILTFIAPLLVTFFAAGTAQILGIISWACMAVSFFPILRFYNRSPLQSAALPIAALFYGWFTLDSAWQYWQGKGGAWKGRIQATHPERA